LRVLVADDHETNRGFLRGLLATWGITPTTASSAASALAAVQGAAALGQPFDLVLLDAHLSDDTGFSVVERLRDEQAQPGRIIMLLSSDLGSGDPQRCRELGIGQHLVKPATPSELLDACLHALGGHTVTEGAAVADVAGAIRPGRSLRVLVAEDNRVNQRVIVRMLEKLDHLPVLCDNGRDAVAACTAQEFDLVLMDVQMPEMDGLAATVAIRQHEAVDPTRRRVPIIALTAFAMASDRERCLAAGMDGYLSKPIKVAELEAALAGASGEPPAPTEHEAAGPAFDEAAALEHAGGDRELLTELLGIFAEDGAGQLRALREAMAESDPAALMRAAHTLKGSLRVLRAVKAAALAEQLEALGRAGTLEGVPAAVAVFEPEMRRVLRAAAEAAHGVAASARAA